MESFADLHTQAALLLILVSFAAGFIDSVAGGGGLLLIPSLLIAGIPSHNALATNKFIAVWGTGTAALNFALNKKIIWRIALLGLAFSMLGSVVGTKAVLMFREETVRKIILAILPFTAIATFIPKKETKSEAADFSDREIYVYTPIICLTLGFYDGFFGPGTGMLLILAFYGILGMNMVNASGAAKIINLASGLGSFGAFALAGKVLYLIGIPLALANILGGWAGSKTAMKKGQGFIKVVILIVFIIMFATLLKDQPFIKTALDKILP